ncbi:DNA dC-_dU-editing enzyme APOBEC-3G-like isoform X1 [Vulpes vulpes]|uniref:single-stranded DNA cytosine deaminase n=1 Tax=Vulpes vulpes TaxID=9627 RepID=A0ABM4ZIH7_VULVU
MRGMEPWRLGGHRPRSPMDRIDPETFFFHFPSLLYASGRNLCYLCFQVERKRYPWHHYEYWDSGVFQNKVYPQARCHAESCFLSWFRDLNLSPYKHKYHVTWYLSWSPCPTCAEEILRFLQEYRNVTLSIFTARLYYFWHLDFQDGLQRLCRAGVQVDIMCFEDYKYCWKNFVDHQGMPFQRRNLLKHYHHLATELDKILGTTMNPLQEETFYQQFSNQRVPKPPYQRRTYLCYQLKPHEGSVIAKVCLQNQEKRHAEICFIDDIKSRQLDPSQRFEITCYVTWSPCPTCAKKLVTFVKDHPHISLRLFASRLYFHWRQKHKQGLRRLQESGIPLAVMSYLEFKDCWEMFVDHKGRPFQPWYKLKQYSESIGRRLQRILQVRSCFRCRCGTPLSPIPFSPRLHASPHPTQGSLFLGFLSLDPLSPFS